MFFKWQLLDYKSLTFDDSTILDLYLVMKEASIIKGNSLLETSKPEKRERVKIKKYFFLEGRRQKYS
ncbi:hypothetical protein N288_04005 [Bacillus infantis NRRL B-14911]|uniref:Uncharacterized protein n=1 Tax=Bacillus infantis NRRL B-14911 TaxID=1367477 RepID=U5L5U4_9BACI|nr:hypothetical protein N288_04005 [Bacillus infantis NRRL B-14911]